MSNVNLYSALLLKTSNALMSATKSSISMCLFV